MRIKFAKNGCWEWTLEGGEMIGNIRLPKYLTQEDADRVKAFVQTLVMEIKP